MENFNWTCPYCGKVTTITNPNYHCEFSVIRTSCSIFQKVGIEHTAIACPNVDCRRLVLKVTAREFKHGYNGIEFGRNVGEWQLMPRSRARPQPDYVPEEVQSNYYEACLIANDSPKAAAAMARRCLQGIVRDFWNIPQNRRGNLGAELNHIKDDVDPDTWQSIHAIRSLGDIGAHMEKDVNLIIDVEPAEADLLIELIETLIDDWYVARHKRKERNERVQQVTVAKLQAKRAGKKAAKSKTDSKEEAESDQG